MEKQRGTLKRKLGLCLGLVLGKGGKIQGLRRDVSRDLRFKVQCLEFRI